MKSFYKYVLVVILIFLFGCQQQQSPFTDVEKGVIKKEVKAQFNQMVSAINQMNAGAWSDYYSKDEFLSAMLSTDYYDKRSAWVDLITNYFSTRETQNVEPVEVRVTPLTPDIALMTSEEISRMKLKGGKNISSKHVFTMLWKKEKEGWKILHSHESWIETQPQ